MEILVLVMLALFLIIVAIAIIIYVIVRKSIVENKFNNISDSDFDDDFDESDDINVNIVMPSDFKNKNSITNLNISSNIIDEQVDEEIENNNSVKKEVSLEERIVPIINDNLNEKEELNNNLVKKEVSSLEKIEHLIDDSFKEEKNVKNDYVINVLINKKNYIFLANGNIVNKNDRIKLLLDGKIYYGVVTKANYQRDISLLKIKPRKLNIIKKIDNKENNNDVEFVPIKKNNL